MNQDLESQTIRMAQTHYEIDESLIEIYRLVDPNGDSGNPTIRLLEVSNQTVPAGIMPLGFQPQPGDLFTFPCVIIEVTPEEMSSVKSGDLSLPNDWMLGDLIPQPQLNTKAG